MEFKIVFLFFVLIVILCTTVILQCIETKAVKSDDLLIHVYESYIEENYAELEEVFNHLGDYQYNGKLIFIKSFINCDINHKSEVISTVKLFEKVIKIENSAQNEYFKKRISKLIIDYLERSFSIADLSSISQQLDKQELVLLDKAIEYNTKNHIALYYRGLYRYEKSDSKCISDFDEAIRNTIFPASTYYLVRAKAKQSLLKDYAGAIKDYEKYIDNYKNHYH